MLSTAEAHLFLTNFLNIKIALYPKLLEIICRGDDKRC